MPNVQQLAETEEKKYLDLLKIFAYGTYANYKENETLPPLTPQQVKKLKQLTIVSLCSETKVIPYSLLQKELDISELRELEDLIIDAIYQGIIQGKLDQKLKQLEVESAMGRDLKPEAIDQMLTVLTTWCSQSETLLTTIKQKIDQANSMSEQEKKHTEEYEKRVEIAKQNIKISMEADMHEFHGEIPPDFFGEGKKGRPKVKSHKDHHRGGQRGV